jgi:hypothetical protein
MLPCTRLLPTLLSGVACKRLMRLQLLLLLLLRLLLHTSRAASRSCLV